MMATFIPIDNRLSYKNLKIRSKLMNNRAPIKDPVHIKKYFFIPSVFLLFTPILFQYRIKNNKKMDNIAPRDPCCINKNKRLALAIYTITSINLKGFE